MRRLVLLLFLLPGCIPLAVPQDREDKAWIIKLPGEAPAYIISSSRSITDWIPHESCKLVASLRYQDRSLKCKPSLTVKVITEGEVVVLAAETPLE